MSIRVNVKIGYGLNDLEGGLNDPRIKFVEDTFEQTLDGYVEQLKSKVGDVGSFTRIDYVLAAQQLQQEKPALHDVVIHDSEFGLDNVILLIPPTSVGAWSHHDDLIDYYLFGPTGPFKMLDGQEGTNWVVDMKQPIYPWVGYMDKRNGQMLTEHKASVVRAYYSALHDGRLDEWDEYDNTQTFDVLGVHSVGDIEQNYGPSIPAEVKELANYIGLFHDESDIFTLRPLIYCFWA